MGKPLPKRLKDQSTLNKEEIELAANPLRDCLFEYNETQWWLGWRPVRVLADAIEELETLRLQRLLEIGIKTEDMQVEGWQNNLTDEQTVKFMTAEKGLRPYEIRAYVPAIEDWNLPENLGYTVDDFLANGGIYDAALQALVAAFNPTSGVATADATPTGTPLSPAGVTPSTKDETANQTTAKVSSPDGQSTSPSRKNTPAKA